MVEDLCIRWRMILLVISIDESSSLWNISREKCFEVLEKSSGHSRGILVISCETWRWAALLVEAIVCKNVTKWPPSGRTLGGWVTRRWRLHVLYVGRYQAFPVVAGVAFPGVTAASNIGDRYWFLVIVFIGISLQWREIPVKTLFVQFFFFFSSCLTLRVHAFYWFLDAEFWHFIWPLLKRRYSLLLRINNVSIRVFVSLDFS